MIRLLVISTSQYKELGKFLANRGTFSIEGCYNSLSSNAVDVQNNILKVDKTLYLYQPEESGMNVNIRADMQILQKMISENAFFVPGEIVFMTQNTEQCKQAERYFVSVMEACKYTNYTIYSEEENLSFTAVYNNLLGVTTASSVRNQYKTLWRAERDSDSSFAYKPQNDSNLILEPFVFGNLKKFEEQKQIAAKTASNAVFKDSGNEMLPEENSPKFGQIDVNNRLLQTSISLISGKSKSGTSVWSCALAVSTKSVGKKVLLLDYTSNSDIGDTLTKFGVPFSFVNMKEMLKNNIFVTEDITVFGTRNDKEERVKYNFLQKLLTKSDLIWDEILIATDNFSLDIIYPIVRRLLNKVLLTTVPRHSDVIEMQKYINVLKEEEVLVILNESLNVGSEQFLTQQQVKELLIVLKPKVVKSHIFTDLNLKGNLYNSILRREV